MIILLTTHDSRDVPNILPWIGVNTNVERARRTVEKALAGASLLLCVELCGFYANPTNTMAGKFGSMAVEWLAIAAHSQESASRPNRAAAPYYCSGC